MPKAILDWDTKYKKGVIVSDFLDNIRQHFSVPNPDEKILKRRGIQFVPKRLFAITDTGRFESGLYLDIINYFNTSNLTFEVETTELLKNKVEVGYEADYYSIPKMSMELREFQEDGVHEAVKFGRGVYVVGTAGGKTLLMAELIQTIRSIANKSFTTLIILPAHLVEQTYSAFIEYGVPVSDISQWNRVHEFTKKPIIIASCPTLHAKLGHYRYDDPEKAKEWKNLKKEYLEQLADVDLVLVDEVHSLRKDNEINKILSLFPTVHRFGFTGTLPEDKIDQWNIIGKIGPILQDIPSHELRKQKLVADVFAQIIRITYKNPPKVSISIDEPTKGYNEECDFIYHSEFRNKVISHLAKKFDNNALIMVDKIDHGETLERVLKQNISGKEIFFIRGSVEMEDREVIRRLMEEKTNVVCIAMSKIFSVGINIKNLHYIVFAQGGKAKITIIQSIGRGLRLHPTKTRLLLIDIADKLHYGEKHLVGRQAHYKREQINYEVKDVHES